MDSTSRPSRSTRKVDPLFITASITTIIELATQVSTTMAAFVSSYKNAPLQMFSVIVELNGITITLQRLRSFLFRSVIFNKHSASLIEETSLIVASCDGRLRELGVIILWLYRFGGPGRKLGVLWMLAWAVKGAKSVNRVLGQLQMDKSRLTMMLTMFAVYVLQFDSITLSEAFLILFSDS